MATRITGQEALNALAGFTSPLRTKQECLNVLAGFASNAGYTVGHCWNVYAGTSGENGQIAANSKAGNINLLRPKSDCANIIDNILV